MINKEFKKGEIIIYETPRKSGAIEVRLENDTVWLSLDQIATLFCIDKSGISRHIKNIYKEGMKIKSALSSSLRSLSKIRGFSSR